MATPSLSNNDDDSHPYLLLFGRQETRASVAERDSYDGRVARPNLSSYYRMLRFFRTVEGFYRGSLDLTGRHHSRLLEVQTQWNIYVADFLALTVHAKEFTTNELAGEPYTDYEFTDNNEWETFQEKWEDLQGFDYGTLLIYTEQVLQTLTKFPIPQVQKLCLIGLPPEILDNIFRLASTNQACLLSTTCRLLNDIGRHYVFKSRAFNFDLPHDSLKGLRNVDSPHSYLAQLALSHRERVLASIEFFLKRPDLTDEMRHLEIIDSWTKSRWREYWDHSFDFMSVDTGFHIPLYRAFTKILSASKNITSLRLYNIILTPTFVLCVSNLHQLHTVDLVMCRTAGTVFNRFLSGTGKTLWDSVYNLHVSAATSFQSIWYTLVLCPQLRTLALGSQSGYLSAPPRDMWQHCSFSTLERLCLMEVNSDQQADLLAWLQADPTRNANGLTHFKLQLRTGSSISDDGVISILRAFQTAPLQVLVLDGLAEAELPLFDGIGHIFPGLIRLSLVRRTGQRSEMVVWPHAAWEYAQHMRGLSRLQYFEWNFSQPLITFSTAPLLRFEEKFDNPEIDIIHWMENYQDDSFRDEHWTPILFALRCPELHTFSDRVTEWRISRAANGAPLAKPYLYNDPWPQNSSDLKFYWPNILPEGANEH